MIVAYVWTYDELFWPLQVITGTGRYQAISMSRLENRARLLILSTRYVCEHCYGTQGMRLYQSNPHLTFKLLLTVDDFSSKSGKTVEKVRCRKKILIRSQTPLIFTYYVHFSFVG